MAIRNFRDLEVWKLGKTIVKDVYGITAYFPKSEMYGLVSQMRRASISIPSNIAEGFNRYHNKEYRQFLYIALGSCAEFETQLEIATELGFLKLKPKDEIIEKINHENGML
ncbi:MAG: four helix bundle protein, partial [Proteobacteria bacterium]|nr:four helix bundle protein [Pseudomonadota bacterium]